MSDDAVAPPTGLGAALDALRGLGRGIKGGLTLILILAAWEGFARSGAVSAFLLPPLSVVLERVWDDAMSGDLAINMAQTLYRMAVGFAISAVLGVRAKSVG